MELKEILNNKNFIEYTNGVYSIDSEDYPFISYLGINFDRDKILNFKFYFSFFKKLNPEELSKTLPVGNLNTFNFYYNLWKPSRLYSSLHQGATFAIKISQELDPTYYFHLRLNSLPSTKPNSFKISDHAIIKNKAICYEYSGEENSQKNYFYFDDKKIIETLAKQYGIINPNFDVNKIDELEYIESAKKTKIDLITGNSNFIDNFLKQKTSGKNHELFKEICTRYNFVMYGPGVDSSGTIFSIYFVDSSSINSFKTFDGVKTLLTHNNAK